MKSISLILGLLATMPLMAGNVNGRVISDGKPVAGVAVSDGIEITLTDANGRYSLQSDKSEGSVFVITPSGYMARTIDGLRPGFWQPFYLPAEKEETHDFVLVPQDQSNYRVIFTADMHLSCDPGRDDLNRFKEIVLPVIRQEAAKSSCTYTFNLGDFTHDLYWYQFDFNEADGLRFIQDAGYPTPMFSLMGNHDHDAAIIGEDVDRRAGALQRDCWGPGAYSLNIGGDHWIFLDDIVYINVPGKGKKRVGVKGDRSYDEKFTPAQMAWLEKDLALVDKDTRVYLCTHCPLLTSRNAKGYYLPAEQLDALQALCNRFTSDVTIFSGHIHCMDICDCEAYPRFHQYGLPATSGIMWETPKGWTLTSSDGCDAGVWVGDFAKGGKPVYKYETFKGGENYFRFYDLNVVGKAYAASEDIALQQKNFGDVHENYAVSSWKNRVAINYWGWTPGDKVEMFEKGKALKVSAQKIDDPVKNFAYSLPSLVRNEGKKNQTSKGIHMFVAKCGSASTPVTVRITDASGSVKYESTFQRPAAFDPSK